MWDLLRRLPVVRQECPRKAEQCDYPVRFVHCATDVEHVWLFQTILDWLAVRRLLSMTWTELVYSLVRLFVAVVRLLPICVDSTGVQGHYRFSEGML
jgi:hypothetical protein